eukprot:499380-Prorocentrum_minimum.AAC.1
MFSLILGAKIHTEASPLTWSLCGRRAGAHEATEGGSQAAMWRAVARPEGAPRGVGGRAGGGAQPGHFRSPWATFGHLEPRSATFGHFWSPWVTWGRFRSPWVPRRVLSRGSPALIDSVGRSLVRALLFQRAP